MNTQKIQSYLILSKHIASTGPSVRLLSCVLEPGRYGKLLYEGFGYFADGCLYGQLVGRLPGIVVEDERWLMEEARLLVRVDCKWMMDLQRMYIDTNTCTSR